ncbi:ATP-binding protein [Roseomonas sp. BN140053]|uniref:hybrid sensor histidine kinase/response regulator n=1 Tax=Roseomonas sp. BN140053 TaxID=3391898 RepID=UPI0039EB71FC
MQALLEWLWRRSDPGDFAVLFEAMGEPAALLDAAHRVRQANPALRALLGPAFALAAPAPALPLLPAPPAAAPLPADRLFAAAARPAMLRWLDGSGVTPIEAMLAAPGGTEAPLVSCRLHPLPGGHRLLLFEDLSERRRFRARAEEGERLRVVGQLAGGIAHDFNNLLSVIVVAAEAVRQHAPDTGEELDPLLAAADRGAALVRRLLALAGRQHLEPRVVVLDEALAAMEPLLRQMLGHGIQLAVEPGVPGRRVRVDPVQLDQVVLNLASNARQAMGGRGRLSIGTGTVVALREEPGLPDPLPPGRWSVLTVSDTGPGIPPELLPRIFEPFFTTRTEEGGTGLGLATVHGIIRQSGGALQVSSRLGEGSSFRIFLPRYQGEEAGAVATTPEQQASTASEQPAPATPAPVADAVPRAGAAGGGVAPENGPALAAGPDAAAPAPRPPQVLLVDDEAPLRRLAERALTAQGMQVHAADGGEDALDLLAGGFVPDVLVSDVAMPGMDGLALARAARAALPALRVVLVSGYAEAALDGGGVEPGTRFLAKPYRPTQLAALIREVLA